MNNPILYIIVRTDMDSLNPGKAMAQVAHAANQFGLQIEIEDNNQTKENQRILELADQWKKQAMGFGTTIVLDGGSETDMNNWFENTSHSSVPLMLGRTVDPEYPIRDGRTMHLIPNVMTCMFIFGDKDEIEPYTSNFRLHR